MKSPLPYPIHPISEVLAHINDHDEPWVAIGNFLHDWWCYAKAYRYDLIAEPPPEQDIQLQPRWAVFCAATVEELCLRTAFPCPAWVNQSIYVLEEPWILPSAPDRPDPLALQPFQRRNIIVGSNVLDNKYELKDRFPNASKFTPWSEEDIQSRISATPNGFGPQ